MVRKKPEPDNSTNISRDDLKEIAKLIADQVISNNKDKQEANWEVVLEKISNLEKQLEDAKEETHSIKRDLQTLNDIASRWKGALFVILCVGGFIGWATTIGDKLWTYIHG